MADELFDDEPAGLDGNYRATRAELEGLLKRIEILEAKKRDIADDQAVVRAEAKARGYDMKTFNEVLKLRKLDAKERSERESIRTLYADALDLFA